jgi:hypothetical protein
LSRASRALTLLVAVVWAIVGAVFFLFPSWSQARFPWVVTDFVTMTIGGWCLGTAFLAWWVTRVWTWGAVHPSLVYLWAFGVLELGVVLWFDELLRTDELLTVPYLVALVGLVAVAALAAPESALNGRIFPQPLSPFTVRAFGMFYLALALGALPTVVARNVTPVATYMASAMALIIFITIAAFVFIDTFDFSEHPLQVIYIAAYLVVGVSTACVLRQRSKRLETPTGSSSSAP